ncbi:MAG: Hsp20/alpha crystallin family protein [Candidatus Nanohaloarchaea archaeon]
MKRLDRKDGDVFDQMQKMMEELQNKGMGFASDLTQSTPIDIREEDGELIISADMPGVEKEEINVRADEKQAEISAESSAEVKEENEKYLRRERRSRKFRRTVPWPKNIDSDTVSAEYKDGVLEVSAEVEEDSGISVEVE